MYIIETYLVAVIFCIITMFCWGSWANTQKIAASNWRFELFYWDYVIGICITALVIAFTLGSYGEGGRPFIEDINQADTHSISSALIGGVLFNAANILLVGAISIAGMSVAFPIGIGLALVIGVVVNYINAPIGNGMYLFIGVLLITLAILLNAFAYKKTSVINKKEVSKKGIVLSIIAGILMGLFYKYVAQSMFPDFQNPMVGRVSPYTAIVIFSAGVLLSNFLFNSVLMSWPFVGDRVRYIDYFQGKSRNHVSGIIGGAIWCVGMSFSILASEKAGPAISYGLGQGATIVAALWGIFIWKEFKGANKKVNLLLGAMFCFYLLGLILIILSR